MGREHADEENAAERYARLRIERSEEGATGDWSRFCTVSEYCTRACSECRADAARERDYVAALAEKEANRHG